MDGSGAAVLTLMIIYGLVCLYYGSVSINRWRKKKFKRKPPKLYIVEDKERNG